MGLEQKQIENLNQEENKAISTKETIEDILESKISDKETLNRVNGLLNTVQSQFDNPIDDYVKKLNNITINSLKNKSDEEAILFLTGKVDDYLINNNVKEIINVIPDIKEEKNKVSEEKNEVSEEKNEVSEEKNEVKYREEKVKESYNKLDDKYKPNEEQLAEYSARIPESTKQQVQSQGLDLNEYLKYSYTARNFKDDPNVKEFSSNFENLKQAGGIVETLSDLSPQHISKTADTVVNTNKDVSSYVNNSDNFKIKGEALKAPEKLNDIGKDDEEIDELFDKFADKKTMNEYKELSLKFKDHIVDEEADIRDLEYQNYVSFKENFIEGLKDKLGNDSKEIIKQRVITSAISGLAGYFDSSSLRDKNFGDNFDINTAEDIEIKDDILHIKGKINSKSVGFYYNLVDPDAELESDDFLHLDPISKNFVLGENHGGKQKLGIKLPTTNFLTEKAQSYTNDNIEDIIDISKDMSEFQSTLKNNLSEELTGYYGKEYIVKSRISTNLESNMAAQELQNSFIPDNVLNGLMLNNKIEETGEDYTRKTLDIWNETLNSSGTQELNIIRVLNEEMDNVMKQDNFDYLGDENLSKILTGIKNDIETNNTGNFGENMFKFFDKFSENKKIDLKDRNAIINTMQKKEPIEKNIKSFSPTFQTEFEQAGAEKLLEEIK